MNEAHIGVWGGEHVRLEVTTRGARVEFSRATGTIDEPIETDAGGRFAARGTYTWEEGGAVHSNSVADVRAARYTGRIDGETMMLSITLTETEESVGTFTLKHGQPTLLVRCL